MESEGGAAPAGVTGPKSNRAAAILLFIAGLPIGLAFMVGLAILFDVAGAPEPFILTLPIVCAALAGVGIAALRPPWRWFSIGMLASVVVTFVLWIAFVISFTNGISKMD